MKLFAAFLVVTPLMLGAAHAAGESDGQRNSRIQRSIYDVAAGNYPPAPGLYEGRASAYGAAPMAEPHERLGPGSPNDPEYFQQENNNRE